MHLKIYHPGQMVTLLSFAFFLVVFASCNKDIPVAEPIGYSPANNSALNIGAAISSTPSYSFFKVAATRVGALAVLSDTTKLFTVFLPDNNAFIASGIPSEAALATLPITTVGAIVNYAIVPGEQFLTSVNVPATFPNVQLPSAISIGVLPGTSVPLKLSTFPSRRASGFWDNSIPVITPDLKFQNGVIHLVAGIVAPPSQVLRSALYNNANLSYFKAAITRADSGQTGLSKFDSLLNYPVTNMTVLAPSDAAFKQLIFGLAFQAYLSSRPTPHTAIDTAIAVGTGNGAVGLGPILLDTSFVTPLVTTALVRGVMAYHFLASPNPVTNAFEPNIRVFSVNFPPPSQTPYFVKTLVNSSFAPHPGIVVNATFTGPFVTDLKFSGLGTLPPGGLPFSGPPATAISRDNHAVNGVFHIIDRVLLPQ